MTALLTLILLIRGWTPGLLTLLGISHAGYLAGKTVDHTPQTPPP